MFKVGDIVVCINTEYDKKRSEPCPLILYGVYTVSHMIGGTGLAILVNYKNTAFGSYRFIHLTEYRKQKLQKICSKLEIV